MDMSAHLNPQNGKDWSSAKLNSGHEIFPLLYIIQKYWQKLNLVVGPKITIVRILVDLNLAVRYGIAIHIYVSKKYWQILILNLIPCPAFRLYSIWYCQTGQRQWIPYSPSNCSSSTAWRHTSWNVLDSLTSSVAGSSLLCMYSENSSWLVVPTLIKIWLNRGLLVFHFVCLCKICVLNAFNDSNH